MLVERSLHVRHRKLQQQTRHSLCSPEFTGGRRVVPRTVRTKDHQQGGSHQQKGIASQSAGQASKTKVSLGPGGGLWLWLPRQALPPPPRAVPVPPPLSPVRTRPRSQDPPGNPDPGLPDDRLGVGLHRGWRAALGRRYLRRDLKHVAEQSFGLRVWRGAQLPTRTFCSPGPHCTAFHAPDGGEGGRGLSPSERPQGLFSPSAGRGGAPSQPP